MTVAAAGQTGGSDLQRIRRWEAAFSGYQRGVTYALISGWLQQFETSHVPVAHKVLDHVRFYTYETVSKAFKDILKGVEGWDPDEKKRCGRWAFAAFSKSSGTSGDSLLHVFRRANGLQGRKYDPLFIHVSSVTSETFGPDDTVVFVDDMIGSGDQVCGAWNEFIGEITAGVGRVVLILVAVTEEGRDVVNRTCDGLDVAFYDVLDESDNVFSPKCDWMNEDEKASLLKYCKKASRSNPKGYGEMGLLVAFFNGCPNNSIAALHGKSRDWEPLFRRD